MNISKEDRDTIIAAKENILKELEKIELILIEVDNGEYNKLRNKTIPLMLYINLDLIQETSNA